jgi:hypothetical protein
MVLMKARRMAVRWSVSSTAAVLVLLGLPVGSANAIVVVPERVLVASQTFSDDKSITASCPAGRQVLGAGGSVLEGFGQVIFDDLTPAANLGSVTVKGVEDETGAPSLWKAQAVAICATPPAGLVRVAATSPLNSSNKSVTATCPAGKRVLGTGADINAGNGQVGIDDMRPDPGLTAVTVQALEDETGQAGPWNVTAHAICANPPAGLERVTATSSLDSSPNRAATATCSPGKTLIGTGSDINAGSGQVQQIEVFPDQNLTHVDVIAIEDDTSFSGPWSVTAYGICADAAQRVVAESARDSVSKTMPGGCPGGRVLTGAGADITGGLGQVGLDDITPLPPSSLLTTAFEDQNGTTDPWSLRAYAICAAPIPGLARFSTAGPVSSGEAKVATVVCPGGTKVVSAAGNITGASGEVFLGYLRPDPGLQKVDVFAFEDEDGSAADWVVTAHAMCATPPPGLQLVSAFSEIDSEEISTATATCPAGKYLLGAGGGLGGINGEGILDDLRPDPSLTKVTVTGIEDETGASGDWSVEASAICATR